MSRIRDRVLRGEAKEAMIDSEGTLRIKGRVCNTHVGDLIQRAIALDIPFIRMLLRCIMI